MHHGSRDVCFSWNIKLCLQVKTWPHTNRQPLLEVQSLHSTVPQPKCTRLLQCSDIEFGAAKTNRTGSGLFVRPSKLSDQSGPGGALLSLIKELSCTHSFIDLSTMHTQPRKIRIPFIPFTYGPSPQCKDSETPLQAHKSLRRPTRPPIPVAMLTNMSLDLAATPTKSVY
jgi:hypothetical protein